MLARGRQGLEALIILGQKSGEIRRNLKANDLALTYEKRVLGTLLFFALCHRPPTPPGGVNK